MKYKCGLCTHVYDESKESVKWKDLPENWVCPVCGSPKSSFIVIEDTTTQIEPDRPAAASLSVYECKLCSYIYDEEKEIRAWASLDDTWRCPVCGSKKDAFRIINTTAPTAPAAEPENLEVEEEYLSE
jgi:rubredoxin